MCTQKKKSDSLSRHDVHDEDEADVVGEAHNQNIPFRAIFRIWAWRRLRLIGIYFHRERSSSVCQPDDRLFIEKGRIE
jgi:hypothetical protein